MKLSFNYSILWLWNFHNRVNQRLSVSRNTCNTIWKIVLDNSHLFEHRAMLRTTSSFQKRFFPIGNIAPTVITPWPAITCGPNTISKRSFISLTNSTVLSNSTITDWRKNPLLIVTKPYTTLKCFTKKWWMITNTTRMSKVFISGVRWTLAYAFPFTFYPLPFWW